LSFKIEFLSLIGNLIKNIVDFPAKYVKAKLDRHSAETTRALAEASFLKAESELLRANVRLEMRLHDEEFKLAMKHVYEAIDKLESEGGKVEFDEKQLKLLYGLNAANILLGITPDHTTDSKSIREIKEEEKDKV
jgi:hypothetical protein